MDYFKVENNTDKYFLLFCGFVLLSQAFLAILRGGRLEIQTALRKINYHLGWRAFFPVGKTLKFEEINSIGIFHMIDADDSYNYYIAFKTKNEFYIDHFKEKEQAQSLAQEIADRIGCEVKVI